MHQDINERLRAAVSDFDVTGVRACLEQGGDANYSVKIDLGSDDCTQPETLLQLVAFRISDCMLEDSDLEAFFEITKLLLRHGADPKPAIRIAEERYGKYETWKDDGSYFSAVLKLISEAEKRDDG